MSNATPRRRGRLSLPTRSIWLILACALACALACSPGGEATSEPEPSEAHASEAVGESPAEASTSSPLTRTASTGSNKKKKAEKAARHPSERPMPAFSGTTLAGTRLAMRDLLGARLVLFFFDPSAAHAAPVSRAVDRLAAESGDHNFRVVGVGVRSNAAKLTRFVRDEGLDFTVLDDSSGQISSMLGLRAPLAVLGVDADGYMTFGTAGFPTEGDIQAAVEQDLRERLRLPSATEGQAGALFTYTQAPELGVVALSDGETLETSDLEGRAAIVIFFLHTCPHCHKALEAIKGILASIPEPSKPRLVAVSIQSAPAAIRSSMKELGLDYFDPYLDPGNRATDRWGVTGGVPVVNVLDAKGRIRYRGEGWNEVRDGGMLRMQVARAAGVRVPMLLDPKGYSGNDVCGVCHEQEYATWQYTSHATAFDTLVTHTADRRKDCVGCHVVGFEETGGYDFYRRPAHLENVGCESCHGRGGPHLSPGFVKGDDYADVCSTCHTATHSLGFEYASFRPRISHKRIASLSNVERAKLVEGGGPSRDVLPTQADYVGSDACQSCHEAEYATWQASPHGHAVETLEKAGKAAEAECLQCHTTAYGRTGGFAAGAAVEAQPDLARVGCESCHGPGSDHVGPKARRVGTIVSLGDKCDSCVILKICGSCHDDANDPGFTFKVEERIEAQRHGTIESAATRAEESAFHTPETRGVDHGDHATRMAADRALLDAAFESIARPGNSEAAGTARPGTPSAASTEAG